jgi:adenylate cyclase
MTWQSDGPDHSAARAFSGGRRRRSRSCAAAGRGGFLGLHALGTPGILFSKEYSGFQVAIPVGLLVSAVFAAGSAFVDVRSGIATRLIQHRARLRGVVLLTMGVWFVCTVAKLPPLQGASTEAARGRLLTAIAIVGTIVYGVSAARYWSIFRHGQKLLPVAVIACGASRVA